MAGPATKHPGSASIRHADDTLRFLDEHGRGLFALLWRLTSRTDVADDLLQELTVKLASSDTFAAADLPLAFARRAATNLALDWRRARVRREALLDGYAAACPPEPTPADAALAVAVAVAVAGMIAQEDLARVLDALASLREPDRVLDFQIVGNTTWRPGGVETTVESSHLTLSRGISMPMEWITRTPGLGMSVTRSYDDHFLQMFRMP